MAVDLLEQGPEPAARRSPRRTAALVLAGAVVVVGGALQVRGDPPPDDGSASPRASPSPSCAGIPSCAPGPPRLRASVMQLDGRAGDLLRTRVEVSASEAGDVTVVDVRPGPGLFATVGTALPLRLQAGQAAVPLQVALRPGECGRLPDTPPYVLVLSDGVAVAPRVAPELLAPLDELRPRPCPS